MSTGQSLLNIMEVLHPELQNQPGEGSVAKSLIALNMAQDYLESLLAQYPQVLGSDIGTVVTAAGVETTTFPAGVLRVDKLQLLDGSGRPTATLDPLDTGEHAPDGGWPALVSGGGGPDGYFTNGTSIFWHPLPDGIYTVRYYGFKAKLDITAGGTFGYPDICMGPVATLAARIIRVGLDDGAADLKALAGDVFSDMLSALSNFRREAAPGFKYRYRHTT
jgi:hypothetical protein